MPAIIASIHELLKTLPTKTPQNPYKQRPKNLSEKYGHFMGQSSLVKVFGIGSSEVGPVLGKSRMLQPELFCKIKDIRFKSKTLCSLGEGG